MKNIKKAGIILLIISIIMSLINIMPVVGADTYENYVADKQVTALRPGDEVFFDNSGTDWDNIYIYIWQDNSNEYKAWNDAEAMTKIGETNIYKFTVPNIEDFNTHEYKNIIFKNGNDGNQNQTIALGFIESGFCYIVNGSVETERDSDGEWIKDRKIGYWYLYDKSSITEHLDSSKQYQQNKAKYTDESYGNLDDLITQATTELEGEIVLYAYKDDYGNDRNLYYITIATTLKQIDYIIANLQVFEGAINIRNRWKWYSYNRSSR